MSDLSGRRLIVVGASSGIGAAVASSAVHAGADVAFAARRLERVEELAATVGSGHALALDVTDEESVESGIASAVARLGGLDALVYTAGMSPLADLTDLDADQWRAVLDTNVVGAAITARACLRSLGPGGVVAFVSSISVGRPRRGLVAYSSSKAALDELVLGLRTEQPAHRFVRLVVGDTTDTEFGAEFDQARVHDALQHWIVEAHLYRRPMVATDVGSAIVEVLSLAFAHPQIDISDVRLEPPGGRVTVAPTDDVLSALEFD